MPSPTLPSSTGGVAEVRFRGGMNLPGLFMQTNVTTPFVQMVAKETGLALIVARPWGWVTRSLYVRRTDVVAVSAVNQGSWLTSGVQFELQGGPGVLTFWTWHADDVVRELAKLGYPVPSPIG